MNGSSFSVLAGVWLALALFALYRWSQTSAALQDFERRLRSLEGRLGERAASPSLARPVQPSPPAPEPVRSASDPAAAPQAPGVSGAPADAPPVVSPQHAAQVWAAPPPQIERAAGAPSSGPPDLERLIGANWPAKLGVVAVAIAAAFFLQYAFNAGWIGPSARVVIGVTCAVALYSCGQLLLRRPRYRSFGQALSSGGIIILFLSVYAAYNFYHLVGYGPALGTLVVAALASSAVALKCDTEWFAVLSMAGAFAAPALIQQHGGPASAASLYRLYAFLGLLDLWGIAALRFRPWHALALTAFAGTWLIFFGANGYSSAGWGTDAFAGMFFLLGCAAGWRLLQMSSEPDSRWAGWAGAMICGGAALFWATSAAALDAHHLDGIPGASLAVAWAAVVLAITSSLRVPEVQPARTVQAAIAWTATILLFFGVGCAQAAAPQLPHAQVWAGFGFSVFVFVGFNVLALLMARSGSRAPAGALGAANSAAHVLMIASVLQGVRLWQIPAEALWLPAAALIALGAASLAGLYGWDGGMAAALYVSSLLLTASAPLIVLYAAGAWVKVPLVQGGAWPAAFLVQFLALSAVWLGMRHAADHRDRKWGFTAALINSAAAYALLWEAVGGMRSGGLSIQAVYVLGLAFCCGALSAWLRWKQDRRLCAIYAGIAAALLASAMALQLTASAITIGWAVEATVLISAGARFRERGIRWLGVCLLALCVLKATTVDITVRVAPLIFLWNTRAMAGAAAAAACAISARILSANLPSLRPDEAPLAGIMTVCANGIAILFVSVDLWQTVGGGWTGAGRGSAQQLALSLFWTLYALTAVVIGMWRRKRALRLGAMAFLYFCIAKVFVFDLRWLNQPYRIVSFFGLGVTLLLVSLLYTRFDERIAPPQAHA